MSSIGIVLSEDATDFQRRDWSGSVEADPAGTIFHTPEFLKIYWEEFGVETDGLLLAFGEQEGRQLAACAFELAGSTLRFLGGTEVVDYLGPVAEPGAASGFAAELWAALLKRGGWDDADLRGLPADSAWLRHLKDAAGGHGLTVEEAADQNGVAPFIDLPGDWEAYLQALPAKLRHEIRRKAKKLETETGPFAIETADEDTLPAFLDRFVELHRLSEGPKGVFMVPGMEIFFRRLGEALCANGMFRLTFVRVAGELAAGTIGFRYRKTYSLYNSAFDRRWQQLSPGMVLVAEDIRAAIEEGSERFDLLKGDYPYKYRFGAKRRTIRRLLVRR